MTAAAQISCPVGVLTWSPRSLAEKPSEVGAMLAPAVTAVYESHHAVHQ